VKPAEPTPTATTPRPPLALGAAKP
jgi:hypothetical protein